MKILHKGFTLIEMVIVIALIAILLAIGIPVFNGITSSAQAAACAANRRSLLEVLTARVLIDGDADLAAAYQSLEDKDKYVCPAWGNISVENGMVICSIHSADGMSGASDLAWEAYNEATNSGRKWASGDTVISLFYQKNGNSLPSVAKGSALWDQLFSKDLYENASTLYWRPKVGSVNGKTIVFMYASPAPGATGDQWKGYAIYYGGKYYTTSNIAKNGKINRSNVQVSGSYSSFADWLAQNGWKEAD